MSALYSRHPVQAFGLAVMIELGLLACAVVVLGTASRTKPALSETMPIELENAQQPSLKPPEPKPPVPPKPKQPTPPPKEVQKTPPPPPAPTPAASAAKLKPSDEYAAKVHTAVQVAHYYPPAAQALRYAGRVRVEFHLRDGAPGQARLLAGSSIGLIDRAALQAVQSARYPETPPELRGTDLIFQVWVEFDR